MRRRILTSMVSVTVLAVLVFAVPLGFAAARVYRGREVSALERAATRAAGALPATGLHGTDPIELPEHPSRVQIALYDERGVRVAGSGPATGGTEVFDALSGSVNDDHDGAWLAVAVPVHDEEQIVGAARAATTWNVVTHDTYRSWLVLAAIGLVAVGLAAAVALRQSRRLVAPMDDLARMAVRLGDGDFSSQLASSGVVELDRATDALNRTAARLGEILARERAFTADVSHQLNTPLTSLRLGIESALVTPGVDREQALHDAMHEVDRLQATIATLLAVARDAIVAVDARCDVSAVCNDAVRRARSTPVARGRRLLLELDDGLPPVRCPANVLLEILAVLLDNAVRHGAGTVSVTGRATGGGVVVEVHDEGTGILDASSVFQRRSTEANGHGIGLALARSLAEAHDARLLLTRAAPPIFTLALPASRDQADAVSTPAI
jgi:signal transduction histidine kinase